jgi:hypothetical protein
MRGNVLLGSEYIRLAAMGAKECGGIGTLMRFVWDWRPLNTEENFR